MNKSICFLLVVMSPILIPSFTLRAQVQIDKPLQMTGGSGQRAVTNLETPVNGTDAANKAYVDAQIASLSGGSFTFSITPGRSNITFLEMPNNQDSTRVVVQRLTGVSGVATLSATGFPSGIAWDFYAGGGYVSYQSILKMRRVSAVTPGTYPITITGVGGGNTVTASFNLVVTAVKRVFITSTSYTGNLGGLSGADALCQGRANAASLGGTWKAWLSSTTTSAASRLAQSSGPYVTLGGVILANNWADLTDGNLNININKTELNTSPTVTYSGYPAVWSNTLGNGNSSTNDCSNWSSASGSLDSYVGLSFIGVSTNEWTRWTGVQCSIPQGLYCFEQ
jgi:hypothetical protein